MNIPNLTFKGLNARVFALLTIVSLLLSAFPAAFFVAEAGDEHKVTICHYEGNDQYEKIKINKSAVSSNGQGGHGSQHSNDIIPSYNGYNGRNWNAEGQAIYNNDCKKPDAAVSIDAIGELQCGIKEVDLSGMVTFLIPTDTDELVIKLDGNVVYGDEDIDDEGPDGVPQPWDYTLTGLSTGSHSVEVIMYDVPGDYNSTVKASASTSFTIDKCQTSDYIVVTGDTSSGENQPGWLFNRDSNNTTPIEFNDDEASIGTGSLYVEPLSNTDAPRKFIGEYFYLNEISKLTSFSYDFLIGSGGDDSDKSHFYLNVYANYSGTPINNYYDCRYDIVPASGSTGSFTPATFDPTQSYTVTPNTCPSIPANMGVGATIRAFAVTLGDTSLNDADLDGYFDNVVVVTDDGNTINTTTYDFEPLPEAPRCENLLTNGSFEEDEVDNANLWDKFASVTGWFVNKVTGGDSTTLELHEGWSGNEAAHGDQYAELDGDEPTRISQSVSTTPGATYELKWAFAPRQDTTAAENELSVEINGNEVKTNGPLAGFGFVSEDDWLYDSYTFKAEGSNTEISFKDLGPEAVGDGADVGTFLDDAQLCFVKDPEPEVKIVATKIICEDESLLPNDGYSKIDENTATNFLAGLADDDKGKCRLATEDEFEFQWALGGVNTAQSPDNAGELGGVWQSPVATDANGQAIITISDDTLGNNNKLSVREVMNTADYIPFTGTGGSNVSAELYCHTDAANYDNLDWISGVSTNKTYHCVGWNVPLDKTSDVTMCKYDDQQNPLSGWQLLLLGEEVDSMTVTPDGSTQSFSQVPVGSYVLKSEGTYEYRGSSGLLADSRFSERKVGDDGYGTYPYQPWREANNTTGGLALQVNNDLGVLWGSVYNSSHVYYGSLNQITQSDVNFYVYDDNYNDNVGELDVTLYEGYTGVTGDNGCVTFTDVPFGTYTRDEIMQDDWDNVSGLGEVEIDETIETLNVVNRDLTRVPVATVNAQKIVCTDESELPNWGAGLNSPQNITADTAQIWVNTHASCNFAEDWDFEWALQGTNNPDNDLPDSPLYGYVNGDWNAFGETDASGLTTVNLSADEIDGKSYIWVREVLPENERYIPFTYGPNNTTNEDDYSAEMYCHTDVANYDNYDRVDGISVDNEYYCVAWNAPVPPEFTGAYCGDNNIDEELGEQCEIGEEGCTDFCRYENQCLAEQFFKIDLDVTESESFDGKIYLGSAANTVPSGVWIPFDVDGDQSYVTIANDGGDAGGLAVERDTDNDKLFLAYRGGNARTHLDIVSGSIETVGINLGDVERKPNPTYKLENSGEGFVDVFDVDDDNDTVDFLMKADTGHDGVSVEVFQGEEYGSCEPETYIIDGYKYGLSQQESIGLIDWVILLKDDEGEIVASTTTNESGYYSFEVVEGDYEVHEQMKDDWTQLSVVPTDGILANSEGLDYCEFEISDYNSEPDYSCTFYNEYDPQTPDSPEGPNGPTYGTFVGFSNASRQPLVAGASTDFCPLINDYMQIGVENNPFEVTKLQLFLNMFRSVYGGVENPITGVFGQTTDANVKAFQEYYRSEILDPWFNLGIVPHNQPTGFVYKLTKWKINSLVCPIETNNQPSLDGEDLNSNVDLD